MLQNLSSAAVVTGVLRVNSLPASADNGLSFSAIWIPFPLIKKKKKKKCCQSWTPLAKFSGTVYDKKCVDRPAHPHSVIRLFVIHSQEKYYNCLESIIAEPSTCSVPIF